MDDQTKPVWRVLYSPPLKKHSADLQWRILHGAVTVNAFVSILNPVTLNKCPFCNLTETIFHFFLECNRLNSLFAVLTHVFNQFGEKFSGTTFILGASYKKTNRIRWQLLNFLLGEAKLAVYVSRNNKMKDRAGQEVTSVWRCSIRSRLWLEFKFYKTMSNLEMFEQQWCYKDIICTVQDEELHFVAN